MFRDGSTWFLPLTELPVHWGEREMYKPVVIMPLDRVITDTHTFTFLSVATRKYSVIYVANVKFLLSSFG